VPLCLAAAALRRSPSLRPDSQTSRFYESHVRRFGYDYRALGFGRPASQEKRFEVLASLGGFHGRRLLDAGCGFGDLLAWLGRRGVRPEYTGVDLCPPMVERCKERFAEECASGAARFVAADAFDYRPASQYDFVVASGIFGYAARDTRSRMLPMIERMFSWCSEGLAVNFLSRRAPRHSPERLYLDPQEVLAHALQLTPAVRLDHSYMPNDFTLFLYRTPSWQKDAS
jgi:SAM-dependent methyltransferase